MTERSPVKAYEYLAEIPGTSVYAGITKIGGGTVGQSYVGAWEALLTVRGYPLLETDLLVTPCRATHAQVAEIAFTLMTLFLDTPLDDDEGTWCR